MNPFRRAARTQAPRLSSDATRAAWQLISLLIDYPTATLVERVPMFRQVASGLPADVARPVHSLLDHVAATPLETLQRNYVETFDHTRKCCLYLTYFSYGDTRRRGVALVQFKQLYRRAGLDFDSDELPDHLGVVLEFGASGDLDAARKLLTDHRAAIEMLRIALQDRNSPWAEAVVALAATLPGLDGDGLEAVQRLIEQGPPAEEVGLEGYAIDPALWGPTATPSPGARTPADQPSFPTIRVGAPS